MLVKPPPEWNGWLAVQRASVEWGRQPAWYRRGDFGNAATMLAEHAKLKKQLETKPPDAEAQSKLDALQRAAIARASYQSPQAATLKGTPTAPRTGPPFRRPCLTRWRRHASQRQSQG